MAEQHRHGLSKAGYTPLQEGAHWLAVHLRHFCSAEKASRELKMYLLKAHAVQHLLHLDLVHTHRADGNEFAFEVAPRHGFEGRVV